MFAWTSSKVFSDRVLLEKKGNLFCFAIWQILQERELLTGSIEGQQECKTDNLVLEGCLSL